MNQSLFAHFALFIVACLYGANYIIAKNILDPGYLHPMSLTFLRITSGMILFSLIGSIFFRGRILKPDHKRLLICGFFGACINQYFFLAGLKLSSPINASLILTTTPIIVVIFSWYLLKEKVTKEKIGGIICGLLGAFMLITNGFRLNYSLGHFYGDGLILLNAMSYGFYMVYVKSLLIKYHPFLVAKWVFIYGFLFSLPAGFIYLPNTSWETIPVSIYLSIIYVLVGATFLVYLFNLYGIQKLSPNIVAFYIYLQPLIASALAITLAKDYLSAEKLIAALLIFLGVFLVSNASKNFNLKI